MSVYETLQWECLLIWPSWNRYRQVRGLPQGAEFVYSVRLTRSLYGVNVCRLHLNIREFRYQNRWGFWDAELTEFSHVGDEPKRSEYCDMEDRRHLLDKIPSRNVEVFVKWECMGLYEGLTHLVWQPNTSRLPLYYGSFYVWSQESASPKRSKQRHRKRNSVTNLLHIH